VRKPPATTTTASSAARIGTSSDERAAGCPSGDSAALAVDRVGLRPDPPAASARSRSIAIDFTSSGPAVGRGIVGRSVITVSPTWHCIACLHCGQRSSGAVANLSTS
jgi:hypothetical protein